jgi:hypothetical protein
VSKKNMRNRVFAQDVGVNSKVLKKVGGSKTVPAFYVTPAMRNPIDK